MASGPMESRTVRHIYVRGRVQGVGFRAWLRGVAVVRGLRGWVRNRHDGSVEAVLAGREAAVAEALSLCRQGPISAHVTALEVNEIDKVQLEINSLAEFTESFDILPTV